MRSSGSKVYFVDFDRAGVVGLLGLDDVVEAVVDVPLDDLAAAGDVLQPAERVVVVVRRGARRSSRTAAGCGRSCSVVVTSLTVWLMTLLLASWT